MRRIIWVISNSGWNMSPVTISGVTLAFVFGGALLGMSLRAILPENHLSHDSKDVVKVGIGLIGTMAALVLGLLIASAKSSYDTQFAELTEMSSKMVLLDRVLAHYGPEGQECRELLRASATRTLERLWPAAGSGQAQLEPLSPGSELLYDKLQELVPKNEAQRSLQAQALSIAVTLGQTRWLMLEQNTASVSAPLLGGNDSDFQRAIAAGPGPPGAIVKRLNTFVIPSAAIGFGLIGISGNGVYQDLARPQLWRPARLRPAPETEQV